MLLYSGFPFSISKTMPVSSSSADSMNPFSWYNLLPGGSAFKLT